MSAPKIPTHYKFDPVVLDGTVDVNLQLEGPDAVLTIDAGLNDINADIGLSDVNVDLGLDNVKVDIGLDDVNACISIAIKEVPPLRVQVPTNYDLGFRLFGIPIFGFSLCGKTMILTEDNPTRFFRKPTKVTTTGAKINIKEKTSKAKR